MEILGLTTERRLPVEPPTANLLCWADYYSFYDGTFGTAVPDFDAIVAA